MLISFVLFVLFFAISFFGIDPDFGWHLQSGKYIIAHGIPHYDIFTYTAKNFIWINHEWLSDVIVVWLYNFGGYALLATFFSLIWTGSIIIASRKHNWFLVSLAALAVLSYAGVRPVAWSLLFFVLLERLLENKSKYKKIIIPLLFLIWANLHGGFVLGLVILAAYILIPKMKVSPLIFFASFIATLINPYGINLYTEIIRTLVDPRIHFGILEWQPFFISSYGIFYIGLFGALFLFTYKKGRRLYKMLSLPGVLLAGSFLTTRFLPFFVVSSQRYLEQWFLKFKQLIPKNLTGTRLLTWQFLNVLAIGIVVYGVIHKVFTLSKDPESTYPKRSVAYLKNHPCQGNIFNAYNYGGYLIWKLPQKKVYIDGRMPSWQDSTGETYLVRYGKVLQDKNFREKEFNTYDIQCAILYRKRISVWYSNFFHQKQVNDEIALSQQLAKEGWRKIITEDSSILLLK